MAHNNSGKKRKSDHVAKRTKRLRKEMRISPWKDDWELKWVGQALLSTIDSEQKEEDHQATASIAEALEMVIVWKARSHAMEALPHAVESTASLAQVHWRDQVTFSQKISSDISLIEIRLAYSSAIVRCINGFADALQQQRGVAAPVSMLCGQLGIPSWVVDIRHEASHNALPTLPVLRLAASTLLDYLRAEYWTPTTGLTAAPEKEREPDDSVENEATAKREDAGIKVLLEYKACATSLSAAISSAPSPVPVPATSSHSDSNGNRNFKKSKGKIPASLPITTTQPFDTFFGDGSSDSSSDGDDWEDPLLGSLWGTSVGTSTNRFAALEPPKKTKTAPKKRKKNKPEKLKALPLKKKEEGEKYPIDFAKDFISEVSPQEGYGTAIRFLVWGGIGGAPEGRGVLMPGSTTAFPCTQLGILKSWQRYRPLVEVLGRSWPGFCSTLLVHLVDLVLSIEAKLVEKESEDAGSARKLFFLSAWIRALVSEQFIGNLYPDTRPTTTSKGKKTNAVSTEIALADHESMEPLEYPLNSICDRCTSHMDHEELRKTSHDVLQSFEKILGPRRTKNYGVPTSSIARSRQLVTKTCPGPETQAMIGHGPVLSDGKMSLSEIEVMLLDGDDGEYMETHSGDPLKPAISMEAEPFATEIVPEGKQGHSREDPAPMQLGRWSRCTSWDACTVGTMPGFPV